MKSLTTLSTAIALAFAFSGPAVFAPASAQAGVINTFDEWGATINEWWEDGGKINNLLGDLEEVDVYGSLGIVTPAHASAMGEAFTDWSETMENWWEDGAPLNRGGYGPDPDPLIEDLEHIEEVE